MIRKKDLLLHTCCATCLGYVYEILEPSFRVIPYFYNPNIAPDDEYIKRLKDVEKFCSLKNIDLEIGEYNISKWEKIINPYSHYSEGSERCTRCFEMRFESAFNFAEKIKIDTITTTLTISPHKNAELINSLGKDMSKRHGIEFLEKDFKKKDGFKKASILSDTYGFYKQNYCGCIYSRKEREDRLRKKNNNEEQVTG